MFFWNAGVFVAHGTENQLGVVLYAVMTDFRLVSARPAIHCSVVSTYSYHSPYQIAVGGPRVLSGYITFRCCCDALMLFFPPAKLHYIVSCESS